MEEAPKIKRVTYEELRNRNRDGQEARTVQKPEIRTSSLPIKEKGKYSIGNIIGNGTLQPKGAKILYGVF